VLPLWSHRTRGVIEIKQPWWGSSVNSPDHPDCYPDDPDDLDQNPDKDRFGEVTLETLAEESREIIASTEHNNWLLGETLSQARVLCESPDCGIDGDNPDVRYGAWVSEKVFDPLTDRTLLNIRRMWQIFGERHAIPVCPPLNVPHSV